MTYTIIIIVGSLAAHFAERGRTARKGRQGSQTQKESLDESKQQHLSVAEKRRPKTRESSTETPYQP